MPVIKLSLGDETDRRLRALAADRDVSMSALVTTLIYDAWRTLPVARPGKTKPQSKKEVAAEEAARTKSYNVENARRRQLAWLPDHIRPMVRFEEGSARPIVDDLDVAPWVDWSIDHPEVKYARPRPFTPARLRMYETWGNVRFSPPEFLERFKVAYDTPGYLTQLDVVKAHYGLEEIDPLMGGWPGPDFVWSPVEAANPTDFGLPPQEGGPRYWTRLTVGEPTESLDG